MTTARCRNSESRDREWAIVRADTSTGLTGFPSTVYFCLAPLIHNRIPATLRDSLDSSPRAGEESWPGERRDSTPARGAIEFIAAESGDETRVFRCLRDIGSPRSQETTPLSTRRTSRDAPC